MGGINMYCKKCGAEIPDDVKFCLHCGAPVEESAKPVEPAPEQPGKILIAPAILAIIGAVLMLAVWVTNFRYIPGMAGSMEHEPYFVYLIARMLAAPLAMTAGCLFLFLFGLVQHKKGKTSLLGLACLMMLIAYGFDLLSYPSLLAARTPDYGFVGAIRDAFSARSLVYLSFYAAIAVLLLIAMIGAFKGKPAKVAMIIAGALILVIELLPLTTGANDLTASLLNAV